MWDHETVSIASIAESLAANECPDNLQRLLRRDDAAHARSMKLHTPTTDKICNVNVDQVSSIHMLQYKSPRGTQMSNT